jgi:hypothetical protein
MESPSNSNGFSRIWMAGSALLIAALAVINLAQTVRQTPAAPRFASVVPADAAVRLEQRCAKLRAALAAHGVKGVVGYLADLPPEQMREEGDAMKEYFLTQFALTPIVLDTTLADCAWVVTNFHTGTVATRMPAGFRVVEDCGDGVLLLRKEGP